MNKKFNKLKVRTIIGGILFGLGVFGQEIYYDNQIHFTGFLWVAYGSITFSVLFYTLFKYIIKKYDDRNRNK